MEKKNNIFKNIFYCFFAICFLSAGIFTLNQTQRIANAEDVSSVEIENDDLPVYFSVEDLIDDGSSETADQPNASSLISGDTFMFFEEGTNKNYLRLSLLMNEDGNTTEDIYKWVYYPDETNQRVFYFYSISAVSLHINGVSQNITMGDYVRSSELSFPNMESSVYLEGFEMIFNKDGQNGSESNAISIMDENEVVEGVYTVSLTYTLYACTDGGQTLEEREITDIATPTIEYSFYVTSRDDYFLDGRPVVSYDNFDHNIPLANQTTAYYLYSNYSSKGTTADDAYNIPYVEYDYTRFEAEVTKDISGISTTTNLLFDKDSLSGLSSAPVLMQGEEIVEFSLDTENHICRVYFIDVGDYTISLNAIQLVDFNLGDSVHEWRKYDLTAMTNQTKDINVFMFGYQAKYSDVDGELDENNNNPLSELKEYNTTTGKFENSADITSEFLNSDPSFSQNNADETFVVRNVLNYINNNNDIQPQKTNQTPINFSANATLNTSNSTIYSTTRVSDAYTPYNNGNLHGAQLYSTSFNGRASGTEGTYLYIISYTYDNYYDTEAEPNRSKRFYQVFYFELSYTLPTVSIKTAPEEETIAPIVVSDNSFVNQKVVIDDLTSGTPFNKDITVQIYAWDYNNDTWLTGYGENNGISLDAIESKTLNEDARYTIRLYYKSEITTSNILYDTTELAYFRGITFTIDRSSISPVEARNVTQIVGTNNYQIGSAISSFSTNQNMIVQWTEKNSGAPISVHYRYFSLNEANYYSSEATNVSSLISSMLMSLQTSYLPVNYVLNMSTDNNIWRPYNVSSNLQNGTIESEYVFTDPGLYLFDLHDEAGNHTYKVFMIDNTAPVFAIHDDIDGYQLTSTSMYVANESTLYWSQNKAIYVANFDTLQFNSSYNSENIDQYKDLLASYDLYKDYSGNVATGIFKILYDTLWNNDFLEMISCAVMPGSQVSNLIPSYQGYYVTVPINPVSYFSDDSTGYQMQNNVFSRELSVEGEYTYNVLIRDLSNTRFVVGSESNPTAMVHYTTYSSARQTIIVSHDSSHFVVQYTANDGSVVDLSSNIFVEGETEGEPTRTTYLSPSKMEKLFNLSYTPTVTDGEIEIQIDTVTVTYYPFEAKTQTVNGLTYHYIGISENGTTDTAYSFEEHGSSTEARTYPLRPDANNYTTEGKYVITRTYLVNDQYDYNENDYFERTFVLYVDRNEVISPAVSRTDENGTHLESLVGGDIFIAAYDNGIYSDLVVTFPNSEGANSDGSHLHNDGTPRVVLTTNMLPVNVYVPQYKYTSYVQKINDADGYHFEVVNTPDNYYFENTQIREYALFAEIYKDGQASSNLIARTSTNFANPTLDTITSENGFLDFYTSNGEKLTYLSEAGTYYVTIYQGRFGDQKGAGNENDFEQSMTFSFVIESTDPDFYAQTTTGTDLKTEILNEGAQNELEVYHTNQSNINLIWEAGSKFMTEIDIDEISFVTSSGANYVYKDFPEAFAGEPVLNDGLYIGQLDLTALGVYRNNAYVDVTMRYKNDDGTFYNPVTKRIFVDLSAPSANIQTLVGNALSGNISVMTENALRTYYTAQEGQIATSLDNTSYNISNNSGIFAYYSYTVTPDFLNTLKATTGVDRIYVREFVDELGNSTKYNPNYTQETEVSDFIATRFTDLNTFNAFNLNSYYEIVETDLAGNMTIYTIFVSDLTDESTSLITLSNGNEAEDVNYTIGDYNQVLSYTNAIHNIYATTGYQIENINFFGDEWAQIRLLTRDANGTESSKTLMLTPWDKENAYAFVGSNYTTIAISDLIDGSTSSRYKNILTIYNRISRNSTDFYINIRNTSFDANLTNQQNQEYIQFSQPSDAAIQDTRYSSTYLTYLRITAPTEGLLIYEQENKLGYASLWTPDTSNNVVVTANATAGTIMFAINPELNFEANTRIVYEYRDNYGREYTEIHLYNETIIPQEVEGGEDLYSYYDNSGTLFYITRDEFRYNFNPEKYAVHIYELADSEEDERGLEVANQNNTTNIQNPSTRAYFSSDSSRGYTTLTIHNLQTQPYNNKFVIYVYDVTNQEGEEVKKIYFQLYNQLPAANYGDQNNTAGQFKITDANSRNITEDIVPQDGSEASSGYFSEVRILFAQNETNFIPIKYSISTDLIEWAEITSGTQLRCQSDEMETYYLKIWYDETYLRNEYGNTQYVFGNVPESQIYQFNLSSLTATYWLENTLDGSIIERNDTVYTNPNGREFTNHYLVNVSYENKDVIQIKTNEELGIRAILQTPTAYDDDTETSVKSEWWKITNRYDETGAPVDLEGIPAFETDIIITYIPNTDDFVKTFYTYNLNGVIDTSENLLNLTSKSLVINENYASLNTIELQWSKYYGIPQNEIHITLVKDGITLDPTEYTRRVQNQDGSIDTYNYIYLTHSGKYTITLEDSSGNVQTFNKGNAGQSNSLTFIFLKDVPFTMTYTNPLTGEEETSTPIKQAVYNGNVTIRIDRSTRNEFYALNGYPVISAKRNGEDYEVRNVEDATYVFTEPGYYEVSFTATSNLPNVGTIRQETYQFSIIDPNEHRYSYIYNRYSNYYVEQVLKDGVDITENLTRTLDVSTITINQHEYMTQLPLSYLDEKTGAGTYMITINSNDRFYRNSSIKTTFTYQVIIQSGNAPLRISLPEGQETTSAINVTFNQANVYEEMGKCTIRIVSYNDLDQMVIYRNNVYNIDETSTGQISADITDRGTYYIQIVTNNGENVLFSYKVVKNNPMNAASIIAIVISVLVAIVVIIIIVKLRKRIAVK